MLPLLSLHAVAAQRGDGLHPVLLAGLKRLAAEPGEPGVAGCGREQPEYTHDARPSLLRPLPLGEGCSEAAQGDNG